ncbi:MAG: hypothetical protein H8D45_24060, partial [Bacteroidetes bacterium]|nr:hypothetical protein [Bacteroidota bacterium]
MKKFILLVFIGSLFSQQIPPNDPLYKLFRQNFIETHDLSVYAKSYPFSFSDFQLDLYKKNESNLYIKIAPNINISNYVPDIRSGVWLYSKWDKFSFLAEPLLVNDYYGEEILGEEYTRKGVSGRFVNSYIRYSNNNYNIQFGRSPLWWGQSWESSVIISGDAPSFDYGSFDVTFGRFHYSIFTGQLHSVKVDSIGRFKRYIGGKKLTYLSKNKRFIFSVGDLILYTGTNRSIELFYLNPIVPTFFADLERETERYPWDGVDNDNAMIIFYGRYVFENNISAFFELLIDDFQMTIANRDTIPDALGYKFGIDSPFTVFDKKSTFEFEYTRIFGNTYITRGWFTNWEDRNIPIGYKYGPDCQSLFLSVNHWVKNKILLTVSNTYLEKGSMGLKSIYNSYRDKDAPFPTKPVDYHNYFSSSITWYSTHGIIKAGWNGDLNNLNDGSLYLKLQLLYDLG